MRELSPPADQALTEDALTCVLLEAERGASTTLVVAPDQRFAAYRILGTQAGVRVDHDRAAGTWLVEVAA